MSEKIEKRIADIIGRPKIIGKDLRLHKRLSEIIDETLEPWDISLEWFIDESIEPRSSLPSPPSF